MADHLNEGRMEDNAEADKDLIRREIDEILRRVDSLSTLDDRPEDEILGYDENGIPS